LSTMTVYAQVSEADVPKLSVGMDVYFTTLGGDNHRYSGKLRQIDPTPTVVNNVVLYDALFEVANPDRVLMPQMTAQVFFVLASAKNAVLVPLSALRPVSSKGGSRKVPAAGARKSVAVERPTGLDPRSQFANGAALVSVVGADGKTVDREVKVGVMNRVSAEILSGLEPGEKVVIGARTPAAPAGASKTPNSSALAPSTGKGGGRP
jgi:macrolide-specific efflux system membrane fusion protein